MRSPPRQSVLAAGFGGWAALFSGLGLSRFAFGPLLPAMIGAGWFSPGGGTAQGAANLLGYLLGAAAAMPLGQRLPLRPLLRCAMLLVGVSLAFCVLHPARLPAGGLLFGFARVVAGVAGGILVVLAPPAMLAGAPPDRRGRIAGLMFAGVGCGIAGSALVLPWLIDAGVAVGWAGLAVAALLLAGLTWPLWPPAAIVPPAPGGGLGGLTRLVFGYALNAGAIVPHMLLLSDFVARGLGQGVATGAFAFVLYGLGAAGGPILSGAIADRFGCRPTLAAGTALQVVAALLPVLAPTLPAAGLSGILMGATTPGLPPLVLGRAVELVGPDRARRCWASATIAFAVCQGLVAWAAAWLFATTGLYWPLFVAAAVFATLSGLVMDRAGAP